MKSITAIIKSIITSPWHQRQSDYMGSYANFDLCLGANLFNIIERTPENKSRN
jgi:hypothetical protein